MTSVIALWSRVLAAVPDSRLFLKAPQLDAPSNRFTITEQFRAHGVDAGRLLLEGSSPRADYLAAYHRVDIALDPFPYPGGTTSVEGLWMGVPVLSLAGRRALGRQGASILGNLGLQEWIADDGDDFVARAARYAADPAALALLRARPAQPPGAFSPVRCAALCRAPDGGPGRDVGAPPERVKPLPAQSFDPGVIDLLTLPCSSSIWISAFPSADTISSMRVRPWASFSCRVEPMLAGVAEPDAVLAQAPFVGQLLPVCSPLRLRQLPALLAEALDVIHRRALEAAARR